MAERLQPDNDESLDATDLIHAIEDSLKSPGRSLVPINRNDSIDPETTLSPLELARRRLALDSEDLARIYPEAAAVSLKPGALDVAKIFTRLSQLRALHSTMNLNRPPDSRNTFLVPAATTVEGFRDFTDAALTVVQESAGKSVLPHMLNLFRLEVRGVQSAVAYRGVRMIDPAANRLQDGIVKYFGPELEFGK